LVSNYLFLIERDKFKDYMTRICSYVTEKKELGHEMKYSGVVLGLVVVLLLAVLRSSNTTSTFFTSCTLATVTYHLLCRWTFMQTTKLMGQFTHGFR